MPKDSSRIIHIAAKRERAKEDIEKQLKKLEDERRALQTNIKEKFTAIVESTVDPLMPSTAGLITLEELKEQKDAQKQSEKEAEPKEEASKKEPLVQKRILSFDPDGEEEEEVAFVPKKKRFGMNPDVDTSFLPDKDREAEIAAKREQLAKEFKEKREREKNEEINVSFCYFDGSSHRRETIMKKGATISQFLVKAVSILRKDFAEFRSVTTEGLMFVKEDLIIPHFHTFLDFIATKAMGITGPLWKFEADAEIRLRQDVAAGPESHPVKVVIRSWYEKHKHIYPASRWEAFVPNKNYQRNNDKL